MKRRLPAVPDFELWERVAERVRPLRTRPPRQAPEAEPAAKGPAAGGEPRPAPAERPRPGPAWTGLLPAAASPPPEPGLDRRMRRRLMRGNAEIEAVLDLHGETVASARDKLAAFIAGARRGGRRLVLVITGKGRSPFTGHMLHGADPYHVPEREGRIRRLVTEWLGEPGFRQHVAGFQPAHPKHGGGGAFYVRLRRLR